MKLFDLMNPLRIYNGGIASIGAGIRYLAEILYQTSLGDFVYSTDGSGNVVLDNQGSLGATNDGQIYSGRGLELLATNNLSIPIHHTLGADTKQVATLGTGWTDNGGHSYTGATASSSLSNLSTVVSAPAVLINFTITAYTSGSVGGKSALGTYEVESTTESLTGVSFVGTVLINSVKQITNPNSYLTYYDFSKSGFVTLGNSVDGGSSDNLEKILNKTFDTNINNWNANGSATVSWDSSQRLLCDITGSGGGTFHDIIKTVVGNSYLAQVTIESGTYTGDLIIGFNTTHVANSTVIVSIVAGQTINLSTLLIGYSVSSRGFYVVRNTVSTGTLYIDNVSVKEILPISTTYTLNSKTVNNFLTHTTPWSAGDWTKINNNPNLVGKLALETLGATKTIPELDIVMDAGASADKWYPCSEKSGGYVVDARAGYGNEMITTFNAASAGNNSTVVTSNVGNTVTYEVTVANTVPSWVGHISYNISPSTTTNDYYYVEFDLEVIFGTVFIQQVMLNSAAYINKSYGVGIHKVAVICYNVDPYPRMTIAPRCDTLWKAIFSNPSVKKIEKPALAEIANYTSTVRTNADFSQKGLQTTAFVQDGAGVPTSYSSNLLQFNGDGRYVDTKWIPSHTNPWAVELILYLDTNNANYRYCGLYDATVGVPNIIIGQTLTNDIEVRIGNVSRTITKTTGAIYHIFAVNNGSGSKVYINGVDSGLDYSTVSISVATTKKFFIGKLNFTTAYDMYSYTTLPRIHIDKAPTATEVATAYTQAKLIYPSLP